LARAKRPGLGKILRQAEAHGSLQRRVLERGQGLVVHVQQPARIADHDLARLRQGQPAALLAQEALTGLLFELAKLETDRRLRAPEPLGRLGVTAEIEAHHERAKDVEIKVERHSHSSGFLNGDF
jgi:hypothetical protein